MSKAISGVDHVDGMLPIPQLFAYGLQPKLAERKITLQNSGKFIPWQVITVSVDGKILS